MQSLLLLLSLLLPEHTACKTAKPVAFVTNCNYSQVMILIRNTYVITEAVAVTQNGFSFKKNYSSLLMWLFLLHAPKLLCSIVDISTYDQRSFLPSCFFFSATLPIRTLSQHTEHWCNKRIFWFYKLHGASLGKLRAIYC